MHYKEYKSILSPKNGMNIYRGCTHGCIYCDSRSKCYQMNHEFTDIEIKKDAPMILDKELARKRHPVMVGTGSMTDPYLHLEDEIKYTRECLKVILKHNCGVAIITKSTKILRDLDLLKEINKTAKVVVMMTLTTADDNLCKIIEPAVSVTSERVACLKRLHEEGIPTIVWFTPLLPYINDTKENVLKILDYCEEAKIYGMIFFGIGVTLREGNIEYFYKQLDLHFKGLRQVYEKKYKNAYEVSSSNNIELSALVKEECKKRGIILGNERLFRYLNELPDKEGNLFSSDYYKDYKVEIRKATNNDIESIANVHYKSWMESFLGLIPYEYLKQRNVNQSINSLSKYIDSTYVATIEKNIVGFSIYRKEARDFVSVEDASEIQGLYVLEEYQNLGIGSKLLDASINEIKPKKVVLYVLYNNEHAIEFYIKKGFKFTDKEMTIKVPGGILKEKEMVLD